MTDNIPKPQLTPSGSEKLSELFGGFDFDEIVQDIVNGRFSINGNSLIQKLMQLFLGELKASFAIMGSLSAIIIICALINNLQESFKEKDVTKAAHYACFIYIATIGAAAFSSASGYVTQTIKDITVIIKSIVPVMAMLCASGGSITLGTMSHPVIFFICAAMGALLKNIITPLVLLRAACSMLGAMTKSSALDEFAELFSKLHKALLALSMTLFSGILAITKFASSSFDTLAARGVKFAVSTAVPVVGGSLSEAMNSVASSAALLKNAVGIAGIIMLFSMFAVPMIKLGALSAVYKISSAVASPIADKDVIKTLKSAGECIDMLFSSVACMGVIMVIAVASVL